MADTEIGRYAQRRLMAFPLPNLARVMWYAHKGLHYGYYAYRCKQALGADVGRHYPTFLGPVEVGIEADNGQPVLGGEHALICVIEIQPGLLCGLRDERHVLGRGPENTYVAANE